jgi:paraquat-inducible protein B
MTSNTELERDEKPSTIKETPRSTATDLDKVRNLENEKRYKLITAQDELDATQDLLNILEETRTASVKKTEKRLLNMVKIQGGSLERAAAAWRLAHEVLKETEARLRAGSAVTPTATTDRSTSAAAPRPHFMALSFLHCPESKDTYRSMSSMRE